MSDKFFHLFWMFKETDDSKLPSFPAIVQEKFDGVRAIYDPSKNGFWLRAKVDQKGRFIQLPKDFVTSTEYLDGELVSREYPCDFKFTSGTVRRKKPQFEFWQQYLKFVVFDTASPEHAEKPYRDRLEIARSAASTAGPFVEPVEILAENVTSVPEIEALRDIVVDRGGEGVISRYMDGKYTPGRSRRNPEDFKFKRVYRVTGIVRGYIRSNTPRFAIGSIRVSIPELGIEDQKIGSGLTNVHRKTEKSIRYHFPVDSEVTIEFFERTDAGKLREPRIVFDD